jgi:hypothetical protein
MSELQSTNQLLMIRPVRFAGNEQTAASNRFQQLSTQTNDVQALALAEFDSLVNVLRAAGITVHVLDDTPEPYTPDSIFPNNWVSFHADGTVVLYPMLAANRRLERRMDVLQQLSSHGLRITQTIDLSGHEAHDKFLEGTGSVVLDREHRLAYACISPRTDLDVLGEFAQRLDYELVTFDAADANGVPIYHTNVLLCIGTRFAVLCTEVIAAHEQGAVLHALRSTGHEVIEISAAQMQSFAGNMLELRTASGEACVAMSQRARDSFSAAQLQKLREVTGPLVVAPIPTIERLGGGGVRCMLAEIFLPKR